MAEINTKEIKEPIGITSIPDLMVQQSLKHGVRFNILVVGATFSGKSTLIESIFNKSMGDVPLKTHHLPEVRLETKEMELKEGQVDLRLKIIETKGFGDQIDKSNTHEPIIDYIESQFHNCLVKETTQGYRTVDLNDDCVHLCIYMIEPTGHGLKALDLSTMRELGERVNLVPVIAKSDTINKSALKQFKERIRGCLKANRIKIYQFPLDDEEIGERNRMLAEMMPFAVVGSRDIIKVPLKNKIQEVRARQYTWGIVIVNDPTHSELKNLRQAICGNMEHMRENTRLKYYEQYRKMWLVGAGLGGLDENMNGATYQEICQAIIEYNQKNLSSVEQRMREEYDRKLQLIDDEFKDKEEQLEIEFEMRRRQVLAEQREIDEKKIDLNWEIDRFQKSKSRQLVSSSSLPNYKSKKSSPR